MIDIMYKGADTALTTEISHGHNLKDGLISACPMGRLLTANDVNRSSHLSVVYHGTYVDG
jgi:hypothetical protein